MEIKDIIKTLREFLLPCLDCGQKKFKVVVSCQHCGREERLYGADIRLPVFLDFVEELKERIRALEKIRVAAQCWGLCEARCDCDVGKRYKGCPQSDLPPKDRIRCENWVVCDCACADKLLERIEPLDDPIIHEALKLSNLEDDDDN